MTEPLDRADRLDALARSLAEGTAPVGRRGLLRRGLGVLGLGAAAVVVGSEAAAAAPGTKPVSCPAGQTLCSGACRDTTNHNSHCGACGTVCGPDQVCRDGRCVTLPCTCPPVCVPRNCDQLGATCGTHDDGCGGTLSCGTCSGGQTCVGGTCGNACASPADCPGGDTECSTRTCTGGVCGRTFAAAGTATSAQTAGDCRRVVCDGQGGTTSQPDDNDVPTTTNPCESVTCVNGTPTTTPRPNGTTCGSQSTCVSGSCVCQPTTCPANTCGTINDGCGGTLSCPCSSGSVCTSAGTCCQPTTCAQQGKNCGTVSDGCGRTINCGSCTTGNTCGGGGVPNVCG